MLLEVCYAGDKEIWCVQGDQRIQLDPEHPLVAKNEDGPRGTCLDDFYMLTWGQRHIGYQANLIDQPPPNCPALDVLCIGSESEDLVSLTQRLAVLRPKYCIPLGMRATKQMPLRSQQVMATGYTFPKLLRPGQAVVLQQA